MKVAHKTKRDGSEQIMLGDVVLKEKPSRKRAKAHDLPYSIENHRLREIEKVIRHRHGNGIPDPTGTDDVDSCYAYLRAVAMTPASQSVSSWALVWAPWADPVMLALLDREEARRERMLPADAVAKLLYVTMAERTALGLKTIGACNFSRSDRQNAARQRKQERDRNRQKQKRRSEGRKDRASYEATSLSRLKPWETAGISRSAWYRAQRETGLSQIEIIGKGDTLVSRAEKAMPLPRTQMEQARGAGLFAGLGDHPPAELQEAAPHGNGDTLTGRAA